MKKYIIISLSMLFLGIIFFAFYNEIIIIRMPIKNTQYQINGITTEKVKINLYYVKDLKFAKESKEILKSSDKAQTLNYLINIWLNFTQEEQSTKKILLESVLVDLTGKEAFVSFDRYPFEEEQSIFERLSWVEALLKTIKEANLNIEYVRFLVHNQPLNDNRLDFSKSWPINGFIA